MLELADKYTETFILNKLHIFEKLNRDIEDKRKTQVELLVVKTTASEVKNTLARVNGKLDIAEENEFEGIAMETIQNQTHRGKRNFV